MSPLITRCALFLTLAVLAFGAHALTASQVFDKVKDSVVVVKTLDAKGTTIGQGSGVLLPSGKIGTNCHVVKNGARFQVGGSKQFLPATLWGSDDEKDICLLEAKGLTAKPAQLGQARRLKVGEPVYAVGAPRGLELSLSDGIVSQLRGGPPPFIQTTAAISPGSSGGGLFDAEGRLVGFTTLYIEGGQNLNFAMPVEWVGEIQAGTKAAQGRGSGDWIKRAMALFSVKNNTGFLNWCQQWTQAQPANVAAWSMLGIAYGLLGRHTEAIEASRQALRINPGNVAAWSMLGIAYGRLGRHTEAIDAHRQALLIEPEDAETWYQIGVAYRNLQRYTEAIEAFRQSLRIEPQMADAWYSIGNAYMDLERPAEAIEAHRQALRITPEDPIVWYYLAISYGKLRRYSEAIEADRQALRINRQNADAWSHLALSYSVSGNKTAALEAVRQLRRLDPAKADELFNIIVPR